jgi:hypothetical protein
MYLLSKLFGQKRKVWLPHFFPNARLEILLNQWISLHELDTAMSLDRGGIGADQIAVYERERFPYFFEKHGQELLEYLRPYQDIPENVWLFPDEFRRREALRKLLRDESKLINRQA